MWWGTVLTGMLTYDFSLCLIQCAISRCIIYIYKYFFVCDDGDEDDDGALFPQKRRCQAPPSVYLLRNVPAASISSSHLKQTNKATTGRAHLSTASNESFFIIILDF